MNWRNKDTGFTLLEVMIALLIFVLLSAIAVAALHRIMESRTAIDQRAQNLAQLQTAMTRMSQDIQQAIDRPSTNSNGKASLALSGQSDHVTFTHGGYANPLSMDKRSTLQRVSYQFSQGKLWRITWPVLDQTAKTHSQQRLLLSHLSHYQFHYYDNKNNALTSWPPKKQTNSSKKKTKIPPLPKAILITFDSDNFGNVSRLIPIPGGGQLG